MSPGAFNWFAALLAFGVGAGSGLAGYLFRGRGQAVAIGAMSMVGVALSAMGTAVVMAVVGADLFVIAHFVYLVGVVGVPTVAVTVLAARWQTATRGFRLLAGALLLPVPVGIYATHVEPFWLRTEFVSFRAHRRDGRRPGLADCGTGEDAIDQRSNDWTMMRAICSTCSDVIASGIRMSINVASTSAARGTDCSGA